MKFTTIISAVFISSFLWSQVVAQNEIVVPAGSSLYIADNSTLGLFSTLHNYGTILSAPKSHLYFMGEKWISQPGSKMLDEAGKVNSVNGATIEFTNTNLFNNTFRKQSIQSNYNVTSMSGSSFANLIINNPDGVQLESDINITNNLTFQSGHLYLLGKNAVLGNDTESGKIDGYHHKSYFVTGDKFTGSHVLIRNMKKDQEYAFPMGERDDPNYYHPFKIISKSGMEDIRACVFIGTYTDGISGKELRDSTINTTWHFEKIRSTSNQFSVSLQHNLPNEGQMFAAKKEYSYVGLFHNGSWKPIALSTPVSMPGTITTSNPLPLGAVNSATFEVTGTTSFYLSKFLGTATGVAAQILKPGNVFTPNGDGHNDFFDIKNIEQFPDNEVAVYNRWGNEVYKTKSYSRSNRFSGAGLPDGTYFYILKINHIGGQNAGIEVVKGFVTIIR